MRAAAGTDVSADLSRTLKSAAGLLPTAHQNLRVHGVAGRSAMLTLSQSAQVRLLDCCAAQWLRCTCLKLRASGTSCSADRNACDICSQPRRLCFCKLPIDQTV